LGAVVVGRLGCPRVVASDPSIKAPLEPMKFRRRIRESV
jgi:hypothetical protein